MLPSVVEQLYNMNIQCSSVQKIAIFKTRKFCTENNSVPPCSHEKKICICTVEILSVVFRLANVLIEF